MSPEDTTKVLALCACFDMRKSDETDVIAWGEILGDMDIDRARKRVLDYYRHNRERIMPSDILHPETWKGETRAWWEEEDNA